MHFIFLALFLAFVSLSAVSATINCAACDSLTSSKCSDIMSSYVRSIRSRDSMLYLYTKMFGACEESENICFAKHQLAYQQLDDEERNVLLRTACYDGYISNAQGGMTLEDEKITFSESQESEKTLITSLPSTSVPSECTSYKCQSDLRMSFSMASLDKKIETMKLALTSSSIDRKESASETEYFNELYAAFKQLPREEQTNALLTACSQGMMRFISSQALDITSLSQEDMPDEDVKEEEEEEEECSLCASLSDKACLASLEEQVASLSDKDRLSFEKELFDSEEQGYCDDLADKACLSALDSLYDELSDKEKLAELKTACSSLMSYTNTMSSSSFSKGSKVSQNQKATSLASSSSSSSNGSFSHGMLGSMFVVLTAFVVGIAYMRVRKTSYETLE